MSDSTLPDQIKPVKLAKKGLSLRGVVPLAACTGLSDYCLASELSGGESFVNVALEFDVDDDGYHVAKGQADVVVNAQCQRCLNPVGLELKVDIGLAFVESERSAEKLPEAYEPCIVEDEETSLYTLLDQELILAFPLVAYHNHCEAIQYDQGDEPEPGERADPEENPFSVLQALKGKLKSSED